MVKAEWRNAGEKVKDSRHSRAAAAIDRQVLRDAGSEWTKAVVRTERRREY